jgi:bacterioferritin
VKGDAKVIEHLNSLLAGELTAMDQYFVHSRMYDDWGLHRLYDRIDHEFEEEKAHADALIRRILFLEGTPDLATREPLHVGNDVPSMLENDLELEYRVVKHLKEVIACCEQAGDYQTREVLEPMLEDTEEDHAYWLEIQLGLIEKIGLENYLQSQMGTSSEG